MPRLTRALKAHIWEIICRSDSVIPNPWEPLVAELVRSSTALGQFRSNVADIAPNVVTSPKQLRTSWPMSSKSAELGQSLTDELRNLPTAQNLSCQASAKMLAAEKVSRR